MRFSIRTVRLAVVCRARSDLLQSRTRTDSIVIVSGSDGRIQPEEAEVYAHVHSFNSVGAFSR